MTLPSPFEWLADVAIPTAGVLASTAVAVAAFRTSTRATQIAEQAHRDQQQRAELDDRLEFAYRHLRPHWRRNGRGGG